MRDTLLGPDGVPVEGLELTAYGRSGADGSATTIQTTTSESGGVFKFPDLASGTYTIEAKTISILSLVGQPASAPKFPFLGSAKLTEIQVNAGESLEGVQLLMWAAGAIDGVVSTEPGGGIAGAVVEIEGVSAMDRSVWKVDASGSFLAGGLKPGHYQVRVIRQNELSPWIAVEAEAMTTVTVDGLVLAPGTLLDIEASIAGEPVDRGQAHINDNDGVSRIRNFGSLRKGKAQIGPVPPGTYTVTVIQSGDDKLTGSQEVVVSGEPALKVEIDLQD